MMLKYRHISLMVVSSLLFLTGFCGPVYGEKAGGEIRYPSEAYTKLDTFEALNLEDADKRFRNGDYKGAYAAYKAFSIEFARSPALPYSLLRMGRCLHKLDKRHTAIRNYQDVVDYFPDDVRYAAAALFYIGQCHGQNGDEEKKMAVWARMVKDDDYVARPDSGTALVYLAAKMDELNKQDEAINYRWRTAVNFMKSNREAANKAIEMVRRYYIFRRPNHEKLKEFYIDTKFGWRQGRNESLDPDNDRQYWRSIFSVVAYVGDKNAARYWVEAFGDRKKDDEDLWRRRFGLQALYDDDVKARFEQMTKHILAKPLTVDRAIYWMGSLKFGGELQQKFAMDQVGPLMSGVKDPMKYVSVMDKMNGGDKFYQKWVRPQISGIDRNKMSKLAEGLGKIKMHEQAREMLLSINMQGMSDQDIRKHAFLSAKYLDEKDVMAILSRIKNDDYATKCRFDYHMQRSGKDKNHQEKALAELARLKKVPEYAGQGLSWTEAELLHKLKRYGEAINAYRAANKQPDSSWKVADCQVAMKKYGEAINTVRGLEALGGGIASKACLKVADIFKQAGDKGKEVDQLRLILRRYPKSRESSVAHQRLEKYGVKLIGGESKAE